MAHILVIDDDAAIRGALEALLTHHGYSVELASNGDLGIRAYAARRADLIILDLTMPGLSGVDTLARIRHVDREALAVFLTAFGTIRSAVEAMRVGGFDFLTKPFDNDELVLTIERALSFQQLHSRVARLEADVDGRATFNAIIGRSPAILDAVRTLSKVARVDTTVLLLGESGTGKELAARSLHRQSRRASRPFLPINCGAIPTTLADAELFGHERGAFTDARESRAGRFEQAEGGTLFLDEVGELPLEVQAKLLRVLQEREIWRVGGRRPIAVDVRVIAATNRNLEDAMAKGAFREDLFWRLNVFALTLPPLRERRDDIPLLIDHLIDRLNARLTLQIRGVSDAVRDQLMAHDWPGNVRELENVLQRAMILAEGPLIEVSHLLAGIGRRMATRLGDPGAVDPILPGSLDDLVRRATDRVERALIENTLAQCRGNRTKTAAALGISRRTLFSKLKRWELVSADEPEDPEAS